MTADSSMRGGRKDRKTMKRVNVRQKGDEEGRGGKGMT